MEITILGSKFIQRSNFQTWVMDQFYLWIMMEVNIFGSAWIIMTSRLYFYTIYTKKEEQYIIKHVGR